MVKFHVLIAAESLACMASIVLVLAIFAFKKYKAKKNNDWDKIERIQNAVSKTPRYEGFFIIILVILLATRKLSEDYENILVLFLLICCILIGIRAIIRLLLIKTKK